jgi:hypothetical protein
MDLVAKAAGLIVKEVTKHLARIPKQNDEAFMAARRDVYEDWVIEVSEATKWLAAFMADRFPEFQARLEERNADPAVPRLLANYARAADSEPIDERRRMLAFAAAGLVDVTLTVAEHSRVERILRELDPEDVLWLRVLSQSSANHYGDTLVGSPAAIRYWLWVHETPSPDVLTSAGCLRIVHPLFAGGAQSPPEEAHVTTEGNKVLRVLRPYFRARPLPKVPPGRGPRPGDRSEGAAWAMIDACGTIRADVRRLAMRAATPARYDFPKLHWQTRAPPPANAKAILRLNAVPSAEAETFLAEHPAADVSQQIMTPVDTLGVASAPHDGSTRSVQVHGPHDVLRWLADDVEAEWT